MEDYKITTEDSPLEQDVELLRQSLIQHNLTHSSIEEGQDLAVFLKTDQNKMVGGVYGWTWGKCLEIQYLWIHPSLRGQGYGQKLITVIEQQAVDRGCIQVILDTFSFQAPEFYRKLGYELFGTIDGYPNQCRKFFLKKQLSQ